jgi:hypothetical protein
MTTQKMYRYLGRNGSITTGIKLENIDPISMVNLKASTGKILTDGAKKVYSVIVFEDEVDNWTEIDDIDGQK